MRPRKSSATIMLGVHTSIEGGLFRSIERAQGLGCNALQIFGRNPRSWIYKPVLEADSALFRSRRKAAGISPVAVHTTYLISLCTPDTLIFDKSVELFKKELTIAEEIGADYLVTHLGSPREMGADFAVRRIVSALKEVAAEKLGQKTMVLLENTSGGGYGFGSRLSDIGEIIEGAAKAGLEAGLCFDTCHAFAAGYPLGSEKEAGELVKTIDREVGIERLKLIHLNDSKGGLGSHLDRHEHIGKGKIGFIGLGPFINHPAVARVPLILETPKKSEGDDARNLEAVRRLKGL